METKVDQGYMIDVLVQRIAELTIENAALKSAMAILRQAETAAQEPAKTDDPMLTLVPDSPELPLE